MPDALIKADNLGKKFCRDLRRSLRYGVGDSLNDLLCRKPSTTLRAGEFWANQEINFYLEEGDCLGLIGGNGAGKTTLLKMLTGLIKPDTGYARIRGRVGALIALGAGFNPILTGRENIYVNASILGYGKREVEKQLEQMIDFAEITDAIDAPVRTYSSGMQVRLGFAIASTFSPDIMLVDEVLAVGDMAFQAKCFNRLGELRKRGVAFILVSHNMHHIEGFCQKSLVLDHGRGVFFGETSKAVGVYSDLMDISQESLDEDTSVNSPKGSGKVRISSVEIIDSDGRKCTSINPDTPITVSLQLQANESTPAECDLVVYRAGMKQPGMQFSNRQLHQPLQVPKGTSTLSISLPGCAFNATSLKFAIALWAPDRTELYDWNRETDITLSRAFSSTGLIWMPANFKIHKSNKTDK
jgi:lipopolysaccharide transport system ATP-binding protein